MLIFDLDGTLLDTATDLHNALNYALKSYDFPQKNLAFFCKSRNFSPSDMISFHSGSPIQKIVEGIRVTSDVDFLYSG